MIIEKIPDIQQLTKDGKMLLAAELWGEATPAEVDLDISDDHVKLLESRWQHYLENPDSASTWQDVKSRLLRNP